MPKRSSRAKLNNNSNTKNFENNDSNNNCSGNNKKQSPQALETYYGPNELKRQIADALRETSIKNRAKKDHKSRVLVGAGKKGGGGCLEDRANAKNSGSGLVSEVEMPKKMIYADVVRNSTAKRSGGKDSVVSILKSDLGDNIGWVPEKRDMEKSLTSSGEESLSTDNVERTSSGSCLRESVVELSDPCKEGTSGSTPNTSPSTLSNLLANMDPDILHELEMDDTTWEVISIDDWSQCDSDIDEQFHLIGKDEPALVPTNDSTESAVPTPGDLSKTKDESSTTRPTTNPTSATTAGTDVTDSTSKAATVSPATTGAPLTSSAAGGGTALKKKKVVVTRKYIGGVDLAEKLLSLGFQAVEGGDEADDDGSQQWSGPYKNATVAVSARLRCGLLVASVRAESDALLLGLTALQSLIEDTGLLSYANCSLPALLQHRGPALSS